MGSPSAFIPSPPHRELTRDRSCSRPPPFVRSHRKLPASIFASAGGLDHTTCEKPSLPPLRPLKVPADHLLSTSAHGLDSTTHRKPSLPPLCPPKVPVDRLLSAFAHSLRSIAHRKSLPAISSPPRPMASAPPPAGSPPAAISVSARWKPRGTHGHRDALLLSARGKLASRRLRLRPLEATGNPRAAGMPSSSPPAGSHQPSPPLRLRLHPLEATRRPPAAGMPSPFCLLLSLSSPLEVAGSSPAAILLAAHQWMPLQATILRLVLITRWMPSTSVSFLPSPLHVHPLEAAK